MPAKFSSSQIHIRLIPFYLFYTVVILLTLHAPFFWDKDLILSKRAFWFTEHGFNLVLPNSFDNGYPPALSLILALLWSIFGKSLILGHLLMLPFALGIIYQFYRFISKMSNNKRFIHFTLILLLIDTTLMSQIVVVSNDLLLMFFFFLSLNAILYKKRNLLYISILGLALSHFRGIMACVIVFLFDIFVAYQTFKNSRLIVRKLLLLVPQYLPGFFVVLAYGIYHYVTTGWVLTHANSPWRYCYERVDFMGFIFNIGILGWRLIDFGRLFIWIFLALAIIQLFRKKNVMDNHIRNLSLLIILSGIVLFPSMLIYKVLSSHRYLLPLYSLVTILAGYLLFEKSVLSIKPKIIFSILLIGMITGNLWIYPDNVAKGWDSTIAHLPYHSLRKKMIRYIENKKINFASVGSEVPNTNPQKYYYLNDDERFFPLKDFKKDTYIFYSNVFNMFTDRELDKLKNQWILVKEYRCLQVKVQLYQNPEFAKNQQN